MDKTILIGTNNKFSIKTNRWVFGLFGLLILVNGASSIFRYSTHPLSLIIGVLMVLGGLFFCAYGLLGFSKSSKLSLKVKVDDEQIVIKYSVLKPPMLLNWSEIKAIKFGPREVGFDQGNATKVFSYRSNAEVSNDIKQTIREVAEGKDIPVTIG